MSFTPFDPIKSLEKHLGEYQFNSRIPFYNDSSDYTTNAPSYYDDLARKNKLIKHLALRIWEYDEELKKRFEAWDKNLEEFDDEVIKLLEQWLRDGTLGDLINKVLFESKLDKVYVDGLPVNALNLGFVGDGTTDNTALFNEYFNGNPVNIFFPQGEYVTTETINIPDGSNLVLDGDVTFIGRNFESGNVMEFNPVDDNDILRLNNVSENKEMLMGSTKIRISRDLNKGDVLAIIDNAAGSWYHDRDYFKKGEFVEVSHQVGETVYLKENLKDNYKPTDHVYLMPMGTITVKGTLNIIQETEKSNVGGVRFNMLKNNSIKVNALCHYGNSALAIKRCYNFNTEGSGHQGAFMSGSLGYGLIISNSQGIQYNGDYTGSRHGVTHGGGEDIGNIVNRSIHGQGVASTNALSNNYGFDTHANCQNISFNGTVNGGVTLAGGDITIDGVIHSHHSNAIYLNRLKNMNIDISNVTVYSPHSDYFTDLNESRGLVHFAIGQPGNAGGLFNMSGMKFENVPAHYLFMLSIGSSLDDSFIKDTSIDISNVVFKGDVSEIRRSIRIVLNDGTKLKNIDLTGTDISNISVNPGNVKTMSITNKTFREKITVGSGEPYMNRIQRSYTYEELGHDNFSSVFTYWASGTINHIPFGSGTSNILSYIYPQDGTKFVVNLFRADGTDFDVGEEIEIWGSIGI